MDEEYDGIGPLDWDEAASIANAEWIEAHFPDAHTNDGWFIDYIDFEYGTKIYGHGVLVTDKHLNHTFEGR